MKQVPIISADEAASMVASGDTLLAGGFGMTGCPIHLLHALADTDRNALTYVGNNVGEAGLGGGRLLRQGKISRAIGSYFTSNGEVVAAVQEGEIEVELLPQGTLAEALRAGGAGIGGFFTPSSADTPLAEGRETRQFAGGTQVFQEALYGDVAFIRAWKADAAGNLQYRMTENNFNQPMATAAKLVIAEVEHIVEIGELDPNTIHTPGCFVDYLVHAHTSAEELGSSASVAGGNKQADPVRIAMASEALRELRPGDVVNLGIGIPTLVADLMTPEHGVVLHTENGMLGLGPEPSSGGAMDYPVNAGKVPVTAVPGTSYFDSPTSFGMIRGGHVDVAVMGGLQVDQGGNLANWTVPGKPLLGVGGAMDLASGARRLIVTMTHTNREGSPKVVPKCTLPLTAKEAVDTLITDLAVFRFGQGAMRLTKVLGNSSVAEIRAKTAADFSIDL
ncbi:MAG: 3-oxoacid CoA-transferase [Pseudomonadota bacterium]